MLMLVFLLFNIAIGYKRAIPMPHKFLYNKCSELRPKIVAVQLSSLCAHIRGPISTSAVP
jgi:hypothetical protein